MVMISGRVDYNGAVKALQRYEKQSKYAYARALTETAKSVQREEIKALHYHLDRPTPFTTNPSNTRGAIRVKYANKNHLVSVVYAAPIQDKYLKYAVDGGTRLPKHRAIPIPVGQKRGRYGHMTRNALNSLHKNPKVFSGVPHGRKTPGLYKRMGRGGRKNLRLMVKYQSSARYDKRLPFYRVARTTVLKLFPDHYRNEFKKAMRSAR